MIAPRNQRRIIGVSSNDCPKAGVTNKYRSSILLEAASPKYKRTVSVWIVCKTYESSPPRIKHSTDRRMAIYFQILLDTDEPPTLTLVRVLSHIPTGAELATSTVYIPHVRRIRS